MPGSTSTLVSGVSLMFSARSKLQAFILLTILSPSTSSVVKQSSFSLWDNVASIRYPIIYMYRTYIYIYTSPPIGVMIIQSSLPCPGSHCHWPCYDNFQFLQQLHAHVNSQSVDSCYTKLILKQFQSNSEESATTLQKDATRNSVGENENEDEVQTAKAQNPTKRKRFHTHARHRYTLCIGCLVAADTCR